MLYHRYSTKMKRRASGLSPVFLILPGLIFVLAGWVWDDGAILTVIGIFLFVAAFGALIISNRQSRQKAQKVRSQPLTPQLAPGWYVDPKNSQRLRYWDGQTWTEKVVERE